MISFLYRKAVLIAWALATITFQQNAFALTFQLIDDGGHLSDPTPVAPAIGNPGTTLGEQRRHAIEAATTAIASKFSNDVTIKVRVVFADYTSGVPGRFNVPLICRENDTCYPQPLFIALFSRNQLPSEASTTEDTSIFLDSTHFWSYELGTNPSPGTQPMRDVAAHELEHGLGLGVSTRALDDPATEPTIWDRYVFDLDQGKYWENMTPEEISQSKANQGRVVFRATNTDTGASALSSGTKEGSVVLSQDMRHFGDNISPVHVMSIAEDVKANMTNGIGIETCVLADLGWTLAPGITCPDVMPSEYAAPSGTANPASTINVTSWDSTRGGFGCSMRSGQNDYGLLVLFIVSLLIVSRKTIRQHKSM